MSTTGKVEGAQRVCSVCKTPLVCKKITSTWNNQTSEKLQWQNAQDGNPHYYFVSKDNYSCNKPKSPEDLAKQQIVNEAQESKSKKLDEFSKEELVEALGKMPIQDPSVLEMKGPYMEAEVIANWASFNAKKMSTIHVSDVASLTPQEKSALGQKEGMLTRLLADLAIKLRELNHIPSKYGGQLAN